ncbi:MAG: hypothetical protein HYZ53_23545 [Planctomycetes bacterium]|nr:hypothetical protein [Planctomycetota bacterium]
MSSKKLKEALILHQIERLKETYRDFMNDEFYGVMGAFFFDKLYSTGDKAKRDEDFKKLYQYFQDKLPGEVVEQLGKLVAANDLTDRLDDLVVEQLERLEVGEEFTREQYELAYRLPDNYDDRKRQIELLGETMAYFHKMSRWRSMGFVLRLVRMVAKLKGATQLADFMQEGYDTFRTVDNLEPFHSAVMERELTRLDRIWRDYPKKLDAAHRRAKAGGGNGAAARNPKAQSPNPKGR